MLNWQHHHQIQICIWHPSHHLRCHTAVDQIFHPHWSVYHLVLWENNNCCKWYNIFCYTNSLLFPSNIAWFSLVTHFWANIQLLITRNKFKWHYGYSSPAQYTLIEHSVKKILEFMWPLYCIIAMVCMGVLHMYSYMQAYSYDASFLCR